MPTTGAEIKGCNKCHRYSTVSVVYLIRYPTFVISYYSNPGLYHIVIVAQMVEHGASSAKIVGSIPRESKS